MKRADLILIAILIIAAGILGVLMIKNNNLSDTLLITHKDELVYKGSIKKDAVINIYDNDKTLINTITVQDGKAYMSFSTCANKDCMHIGALQEGSKKQIVCLPHQLIVSIQSAQYDYDGVVQ